MSPRQASRSPVENASTVESVGLREGRRLLRAETNRNQILDAAERLFGENGYQNTSLEQIAAGSEFSVGGVYKHFDSKEAILVAVVHRRGPDLQKLMQECASQDLDAVEKMSRLISNRIAFFRKWPDYGRLSARMFSFRLEGFPAPANLPAQIDEFHEFFGGVVAQGQAEGVFCSGSPTRIASLLAALMNAYQQMDPELISDSDGLGADEFLQMALRAISAPKTRSPRARRATS